MKAVFRLSNLQALTTPKSRLGSGVLRIDLPSQVNCAIQRLTQDDAHVLACVLLWTTVCSAGQRSKLEICSDSSLSSMSFHQGADKQLKDM